MGVRSQAKAQDLTRRNGKRGGAALSESLISMISLMALIYHNLRNHLHQRESAIQTGAYFVVITRSRWGGEISL